MAGDGSTNPRGPLNGSPIPDEPDHRMKPMLLLPRPLRVPLIFLLIAANTVLHTTPLLVVALCKVLLPMPRFRAACNSALVGLAERWIAVNSWMMDRFTETRMDVELPEGLESTGHYLVLANHQSWVDILVLQKIFNRRIPFLRFFLKSELIWVPLLGLAWWALDFPFMKRYSKHLLARRPELAGKDIAATRRACEKFRGLPVSVMNFVEGTRFTEAKHRQQSAPFRYLLRPKAGGVAFVLDAMGSGLHSILDVTIAYPAGLPTLVDLVANRIPRIRVHVQARPIPAGFAAGDYEKDAAFRERFQQWINGLWVEKDVRLAQWSAGPG
jgi:1-acyl-sn-glycerol-3-phosphate acyltransferase